MSIDQFLNVTYKLASSDNFDAYLEAMGVDPNIREAILASTPCSTLTESDGVYTVKMSSSYRDHDYTFTPGVEFEDVGMDGSTYRCVVNIDGNKITNQILSHPSIITSEYFDDKVVVTFQKGDVEATQVFEKV